MIVLLFITSFAFLNRARGNKLFERTTSTQVARISSFLGMAAIVLLFSTYKLTAIVAFIGLYLWGLSGWGKYAGMCCGVDSRHESEIKWIDAVLDRVPTHNIRLLGGIGMSLRMTYAAPVLFALSFIEVGNYWACLLSPLMGAAYYITGKIWNGHGHKYGEYASGGILGALTYWSIL